MSLFSKKARGPLRVMVIGEPGEIIAEIDGDSVIVTIRNADTEEKAAIRLTAEQAQILGEVFDLIPDGGIDDD